MIAEKRNSSATITSAYQGLPDTIFAGLRLPAAPNNDIVITKQQHLYSQLSASAEIESDSEDEEMTIPLDEVTTTLLPSTEIKEDIVEQPMKSMIQPTVSSLPAVEFNKRLSKLYTVPDLNNAVAPVMMSANYPTIPDINVNSSRTSYSTMNRPMMKSTFHTPVVSSHSRHNEVEMTEATTNFMHRSPTAPPHEMIGRVNNSSNVQVMQDQGSEQLVNDLIAQNSQLQQEINDLKSELAVAYSSKSVDNLSTPIMGVALSTEPDVSAQISNKNKLKYICCGNCRSWFMTTKDVCFVYCPHCEAVNNCGNATGTEDEDEVDSFDITKFVPCLKGFI